MFSTKKICYAAVLTALTVCLCSFSVPMPGGGHLYLVDAAICFAALVLDPLTAFIVGGVGAFLGDLFFYPAAMFVSLVTHGLQAASISLIIAGKNVKQEGFLRAEKRRLPRVYKVILALVVGSLVMVTGYTLGSAFIYGTKETALVKIPGQTLQACVGAVLAAVCAFSKPLQTLFFRQSTAETAAAAAIPPQTNNTPDNTTDVNTDADNR